MRHSGRRSLRYLLIPGLGLLLVCAIAAIFLAEGALHPARLSLSYRQQIRQRVESQYGVPLQEVAITARDGTILRAWFVQPKAPNGAAVILLHGVGDTRQGVSGYAVFMLEAGYTVLLPDSRGHGESAGDLVTYGVRERQDVHDWVSWLTNQHTTGCVYGFGESMGAAIMLQALAGENRICAAAVESPFASFEEIARERISQIAHVPPSLTWVPIRAAELYVRLRYRVDLKRADPATALSYAKTPVLLIHGTADFNISAHHSQRLLQVANRTTELWLVPGAGHCGAWTVEPVEFPRRVLEWFAAHQSRSALPKVTTLTYTVSPRA